MDRLFNSDRLCEILQEVTSGKEKADFDCIRDAYNGKDFMSLLICADNPSSLDSTIFEKLLSWRNAILENIQNNQPNTYQIQECAKIIRTLKSWLTELLETSNLELLAAFCHVFGYLNVPYGEVFQKNDIDSAKSFALAQKLGSELVKIQISFALPNKRYWENELTKTYKEGYNETNIVKAYKMILAIEREHGIDVSNFIQVQSLAFICFLDEKEYYKLLEKQTNLTSIVAYLHCIPAKDIQGILTRNSCQNKWILFEGIRQTLENEYHEASITYSSIQEINDTILTIKQIDHSFFIQTLRFFYPNRNFQKALGIYLANSDKDDIKEFVEQVVEINEYNDDKEIDPLYDALTSQFSESQDELLKSLCEEIWKKWDSYCTKALQGNKTYLSKSFRTKYFKFVVNHIYFSTKENEEWLVRRAEETLREVNSIDTVWKKTSSEQQTLFFILLGKLEAIGHVWKHMKFQIIEHPKLQTNLQKFSDNRILRHRFFFTDESYKTIQNVVELYNDKSDV